jgi:hypothetical protein
MSDPDRSNRGDAHPDDAESSGLTTGEYLRLTVLNRVSLLGMALVLVGAVAVALTAPGAPLAAASPALGGGLLLLGVLLVAVGFTLGQRALGRREDW